MLNEVENATLKTDKSEELRFFRYAVVLEYIGTSYAGSQLQPNEKTIQSELERVLQILLDSPVRAIFSGRTDAGVHSKGQVVHFNTTQKIDIFRFVNSMNALLPSDISVSAMTEVDSNFHSQKSALYRWYRFCIDNNSQRSAWSREILHVRPNLDVEAMNKALSYLEGKHDFSSFKCSSTDNPAKECIFYRAECKEEGKMIYIDLVGNRFLYNMVRIIVGTLLNIGQGKKPPEYMLEVLNAKDRTLAGPTASPIGLTLMYVGYSKKYNLFECISKEANKDENIFCKAS